MTVRIVDYKYLRERLDDVERQMAETANCGTDFELAKLKYLQAAHDYLLVEARRLMGGGVKTEEPLLPVSSSDQ